MVTKIQQKNQQQPKPVSVMDVLSQPSQPDFKLTVQQNPILNQVLAPSGFVGPIKPQTAPTPQPAKMDVNPLLNFLLAIQTKTSTPESFGLQEIQKPNQIVKAVKDAGQAVKNRASIAKTVLGVGKDLAVNQYKQSDTKDVVDAFLADPEKQLSIIDNFSEKQDKNKATDKDLLIMAAAVLGMDTGMGGTDDALRDTFKGIKKGVQEIPKGIETIKNLVRGGEETKNLIKESKVLTGIPKEIEAAKTITREIPETVLVRGQGKIPVNVYKPEEPGAFPKALRQGEVIPKTPQENIGFKQSPILQGGEPKEITNIFKKYDKADDVADAVSEEIFKQAKKVKPISVETIEKNRVPGVPKELEGKTLYRGMSEEEWQSIQSGGKSGKASRGGRTFVTTDLETAQGAIDANKKPGVIVELKPEASAKVVSGGEIGVNTGGNLPGEYQAKNIGIDDVARVADTEGNIIYDSSKPLELNPQAGFVNPELMASDIKAGATEANKTFQTEFIDKYSPIKDLVKGKNLTAESDPYIAARNFSGHFGKIENRLDDLGNILQPARKDLSDIKEYAKLDRKIELYENNIDKFEGGERIQDIMARKDQLEQTLGPQKMEEVQKVLTQLRGYSDRLLQETRDAGIISEQTYQTIKAKNQKYIPFHTLDLISNKPDGIKTSQNAFSVASQSLIQKIKGSESFVRDPIESLIQNTYKTVSLVERNKVATKVADLSNLPEFKDIVFRIKKTMDAPEGFESISVFRDGVKETYAVPKGVGEALKGMNEQAVGLLDKWAAMSGRALRSGATTLNAAFILPNAVRDAQTAIVASKVGFTPLDWLKGFSEAINKGDVYRQFLESGASSGGYYLGNKNLARKASQLAQPKWMKITKTVLNPVELIKTVGETIELTPRLGVFKRSLVKGLSETEAAFNARNATVDFAKSGNTMKVLNQWVPFLNARLQGVINNFAAIKDRPGSSALKLTAIVGVPEVLTYLNNSKFHKEIWDDIAQTEKDNNFIIIYGDKKDKDGNPTQVIKIPKGETKIFANPLENFLAYLDGADTKSVSELATQMLSDTSPVGFARDGKFSSNELLSTLTPPTLKAIAEGVTNKNFYTGYDIVPMSMQDASPREQYKNDTNPYLVVLGKALGISPLKLQNAVRTQFGGAGQQVLDLLAGKPLNVGSQVAGRFSGAKGGEQDAKMIEQLKQSEQEVADRKVIAKRQAEKLYEKILTTKPQDRASLISGMMQKGEITQNTLDAFKQIVDDKVKNYDSFEYEFKYAPQEAKAKFLYQQIVKTPPDKRAELIKRLQDKKLLTKNTMDELGKIIAAQKK